MLNFSARESRFWKNFPFSPLKVTESHLHLRNDMLFTWQLQRSFDSISSNTAFPIIKKTWFYLYQIKESLTQFSCPLCAWPKKIKIYQDLSSYLLNRLGDKIMGSIKNFKITLQPLFYFFLFYELLNVKVARVKDFFQIM